MAPVAGGPCDRGLRVRLGNTCVKDLLRDVPGAPWVGLSAPTAGVQVRFLVGNRGSHVLCGVAKTAHKTSSGFSQFKVKSYFLLRNTEVIKSSSPQSVGVPVLQEPGILRMQFMGTVCVRGLGRTGHRPGL